MSSTRSASDVTAIVLAAGASRRMGRPKALLEVGGRPLVRRAVEAARGSRAGSVFVVTGVEDEAITGALEGAAATLHHPGAREGIGSSIAYGVAEAEARGAAAVLVLLADQPAVSTELLDRLLDAFEAGDDPVACHYAGSPGPPALFARRHFGALARLHGDSGAKQLLESDPTRCDVPFPEGVLDVDTPEDLARARTKLG